MLDLDFSLKSALKTATVLAVLCVPVNINGNVFTVIGNAVSQKDVWSICSLYQRAGRDATVCVSLVGYQQAGRDVVVCIGLVDYQRAGGDAVIAMGLVGYQRAGRDAGVVIGLTGYQQADRNASIGFGLVGYQQAGRAAQALVGTAVYQRVPGKERAFGAFTKLQADRK